MAMNGYTLTDSKMFNQWILNNQKLCIATKRGFGNPTFLWFEKGRSVNDDTTPITLALLNELKKFVDIAWIGDQDLNKLASVILTDEDTMLEVEESQGVLNRGYNSHFE
jgi:hypothetical protein